MTNANLWLAPIVVALVTALGTYLGVIRRASGRIATTEASKLWDEAKDLRDVYQKEISRLRLMIDELSSEIETCENTIDDQRIELRKLRDHIGQLEFDKIRLQIRLEELEDNAPVV